MSSDSKPKFVPKIIIPSPKETVGHQRVRRRKQSMKSKLASKRMKLHLGKIDTTPMSSSTEETPPTEPESFQYENLVIGKEGVEDFKPEVSIKYEDLKVLRPLGKGISSSVNLVVDRRTGELYALKSIYSAVGNSDMGKIIYDEIRALRSMNSQYIVSFKQAFFEHNQVHILLDYIDCNSLASVLKKKKKIPEIVLAVVTHQILNGLKYLHEEGKIVHMDLKPDNLLISSKGNVVISDFGLMLSHNDGMDSTTPASSTSDEVTPASTSSETSDSYFPVATPETKIFNRGHDRGTKVFWSPERAAEQSFSFTSDIWNLGITLICLRLGKLPNELTARNHFELIEKIQNLNSNLNLPRSFFSQGFVHFIKACLIQDPLKRPTAAQLLRHPWIQSHQKWYGEGETVIRNYLSIQAVQTPSRREEKKLRNTSFIVEKTSTDSEREDDEYVLVKKPQHSPSKYSLDGLDYAVDQYSHLVDSIQYRKQHKFKKRTRTPQSGKNWLTKPKPGASRHQRSTSLDLSFNRPSAKWQPPSRLPAADESQYLTDFQKDTGTGMKRSQSLQFSKQFIDENIHSFFKRHRNELKRMSRRLNKTEKKELEQYLVNRQKELDNTPIGVLLGSSPPTNMTFERLSSSGDSPPSPPLFKEEDFPPLG